MDPSQSILVLCAVIFFTGLCYCVYRYRRGEIDQSWYSEDGPTEL